MVAILPGLDVLKSVTDKNLTSAAAETRRKAFDEAIALIGTPEAEAEIVIDGNVFQRISPRLNEDMRKVFEGAFRVDKATVDLPRLNHHAGVRFLANVEKKRQPVIILSDNGAAFSEAEADKVTTVSAAEFLKCAAAAKDVYEKKIMPTLPAALAAEFFVKRRNGDC